MPLAAALSEPDVRTPKHRLAMPRPNSDPLSASGFMMESLTVRLRFSSCS